MISASDASLADKMLGYGTNSWEMPNSVKSFANLARFSWELRCLVWYLMVNFGRTPLERAKAGVCARGESARARISTDPFTNPVSSVGMHHFCVTYDSILYFVAGKKQLWCNIALLGCRCCFLIVNKWLLLRLLRQQIDVSFNFDLI